jgi:hypothetical protein
MHPAERTYLRGVPGWTSAVDRTRIERYITQVMNYLSN